MGFPRTYVALILLSAVVLGCGHDDPQLERLAENAPPGSVAPASNEPATETFALGTRVTSEGIVASDATTEEFGRAGPILLSVNTRSASQPQTIEVEWRRGNRILAKQRKRAALEDEAVVFDAGVTQRWHPGAHQATVVIDGRKVATKEFVVR